MNSTERASHPSRAQVEYLVEFLQKNPNLAKGFSKVPSARARDAARKTWEGLAIKLNSIGGCDNKTRKQWKKYWSDKKSAVKEKVALRYKARNKIGGGLDSVIELTELEEKILFLMGGETFSIGDRHLAINPFEEHATNVMGNIFRDVAEVNVPQTTQVNFSPREVAQSLTITPPSPGQPAPPSESGSYPAHHRLNLCCPRLPHTISRGRLHRRRRQSPPSQRQSQFVSSSDRLLALEEQRIEIDHRHFKAMEVLLTRQVERDQATTRALSAIADGLKLISEAIRKE